MFGNLGRALLRPVSLLFAWAVFPITAQAQVTEICLGRVITPMDFRSPTLISGTPLSVGAVYRFSNVTSGVEAQVRIDSFNNGASLSTIDRDDGLIDRNFQPELGGANARNVGLTISFFSQLTGLPVKLDFVATAIDIDGDSASLREFAEFSQPFVEYRLNSPTNIDVNASGPTTPGSYRFESRTSANAVGIDPNAVQNIAAVFYSQTSAFQYSIGTLGTGSTVRLTSLDFGCPNLPAPTQTTTVPQDFGDAPASYGNPIHDIVTGIRLGATNTAENGPYNNVSAMADVGDDGVTFSALAQSMPGTLTANVVGSGGMLQGWFDWNGDGDFADAGEQVATNITDNGAGDADPAVGTIVIDFTVPLAAVTTRTFARVRWSTQSALPPSSINARDGEVEDYAVMIASHRAVLGIAKSSGIYAPASTYQFAVPGSAVLYTLTTTNSGTGSPDSDSLFIADNLPATLEFFNGDFDGAGPATGAVYFTSNNSGLTFDLSTDLAFSNQASAPANFAACSYTPTAGYDPNIKFICLNPKGTMNYGTPNPSFSVQFLARIK